MNKEKFYITTAIAYTSKKPHIGNTYEIIFTDAIARFKKMQGKDVFFLTGTDEHGQKIQEAAEAAGVSPKEYVDIVAKEIKDIWDLMDAKYDFFMRTTDNYHEEAVKEIFEKLYNQGDIYLGEYEGMYCTPCEAFYTTSQLADGKCPDCGRDVKQAKEEAYFLKCSKYQERLLEHIKENPSFIEPEARKKEIINSFLKEPLPDLCVSRTSFTWGIPVSFNKKHITYVWIDALSNYITAIGYSVDKKGDLYDKYWPADLHVIGKDILRFHAIYWPIILMALDEALPKKIYAHGWMLFGNDKMSKSKGNVIYADDLARAFGVDATRFYCLSEMPYAQDGNITEKDVIVRYNSELANTLGNLVNRTHAMIAKYFDSIIEKTNVGDILDDSLKEYVENSAKSYMEKMESYHIAEAIVEIMNIARRSNKYIDETCPWILAKDIKSQDRLKEVLYNLAECIRIISVMLAPIMPSTSIKIQDYMGVSDKELDSILEFGKTINKTKIKEASILFERIDEAKKMEEIEKMKENNRADINNKEQKDLKEGYISIDDFEKVKLKVVKIIKVEDVIDSSKLYKITVNNGSQEIEVVSKIADYYKKEELVGKQVVMVTNLKPVKIKNIVSNGMLIAAEKDKTVKLLEVDDEKLLGADIY